MIQHIFQRTFLLNDLFWKFGKYSFCLKISLIFYMIRYFFVDTVSLWFSFTIFANIVSGLRLPSVLELVGLLLTDIEFPPPPPPNIPTSPSQGFLMSSGGGGGLMAVGFSLHILNLPIYIKGTHENLKR